MNLNFQYDMTQLQTAAGCLKAVRELRVAQLIYVVISVIVIAIAIGMNDIVKDATPFGVMAAIAVFVCILFAQFAGDDARALRKHALAIERDGQMDRQVAPGVQS